MDINEARQEIYSAFKAAWLAAYPDDVPYCFENESKDTQEHAWARCTVRHSVFKQETLGSTGNRNFSRNGILLVQIFTPVDGGMASVDAYAQTVVDAFEGVLIANDISFTDVFVRENGQNGKWNQVTVEAVFNYTDMK